MSHRKSSLSLLAVLGLAGLLAEAPRAAAADLDLDPSYAGIPAASAPEQKVEFGSGWYVRGDIGATRGPEVSLASPTVGSAPSFTSSGGSDIAYVASLGGGYQFNRWFRADVLVDRNEPISGSATGAGFTCNFDVYGTPAGGPYTADVFRTEHCPSINAGSLQSYDVLFNGYLDLGTWHGVTPYVGAGIGMSFGHYSTSVSYYYPNGVPYSFTYADPVSGTTLNENFDRSSGGTYYNVAWALMAGLSYDIFDHTKLDVGYRYVNLGTVSGSKLTTQQVRAGLRYMIDN